MGTLSYIAGKLFSSGKEVALTEDIGDDIESGSGNGGYWTKFPDGTMIQYGTKLTAVNGGAGILFPLQFINTSYSITGNLVTDYYTTLASINFAVRQLTYINTYAINKDNEQVAITISWQAIGRWK